MLAGMFLSAFNSLMNSLPISVFLSISQLVRAVTSKLTYPWLLDRDVMISSYKPSFLPDLTLITDGSICLKTSSIVFSNCWSVEMFWKLVSFSKKGRSSLACSWYAKILFERIAEETYYGWFSPRSIILSWQISLEHFKAKTFEGDVPFLKKYLAWNTFYGKFSRTSLGTTSLAKL